MIEQSERRDEDLKAKGAVGLFKLDRTWVAWSFLSLSQ